MVLLPIVPMACLILMMVTAWQSHILAHGSGGVPTGTRTFVEAGNQGESAGCGLSSGKASDPAGVGNAGFRFSIQLEGLVVCR